LEGPLCRKSNLKNDSGLLADFNLLVSSARGNEREANSELWYLIAELGDRSAETSYTPVSGLTVAKTSLDPLKVIQNLRSRLKQRPWEFRYVLKVKPVQRVVPTDIEAIGKAVSEKSKAIRGGETFRVSIEKRRSDVSSKEVIDAIAAKIPRKVDLRDPEKIVLVEIIGTVAGIAVIPPNGILGIEREKRTI
jgi:tRNA acetyltransferase TAN1